MNRFLRCYAHRVAFALLFAMLVENGSARAEESLEVTPTLGRTSFFADESVSFEICVAAKRSVEGSIAWSLMTLHRTLRAGDFQVSLEPENPQTTALKLQMPHVKAGVIQRAVLTLMLREVNRNDGVTVFEQELWVFPRDAFADRMEWLEQLELTLYDPVGDLISIFRDAEIPFRETRSIGALDATEKGILIVGGGIELRKGSLLPETLFSLASRGRKVLWISPVKGSVSIANAPKEAESSQPDNLWLMGEDRLHQLDKRLDTYAGNGEDAGAVGLELVAERDQVMIRISEPNQGYTWLQAEYCDTGGQLILCGLRLVSIWDESPSPRYTLVGLLEQLDNSESPNQQELKE